MISIAHDDSIDSTWSWREGKDFDRVTKYRGFEIGWENERDGWMENI